MLFQMVFQLYSLPIYIMFKMSILTTTLTLTFLKLPYFEYQLETVLETYTLLVFTTTLRYLPSTFYLPVPFLPHSFEYSGFYPLVSKLQLSVSVVYNLSHKLRKHSHSIQSLIHSIFSKCLHILHCSAYSLVIIYFLCHVIFFLQYAVLQIVITVFLSFLIPLCIMLLLITRSLLKFKVHQLKNKVIFLFFQILNFLKITTQCNICSFSVLEPSTIFTESTIYEDYQNNLLTPYSISLLFHFCPFSKANVG